MPSFAERLSDGPIADLANYLRTSWGNKAAANATASMVAAWRTTANVPDYGTQAAAGFKCPLVGGGPGSSGPNPQAVADLAVMIQAGDRKIADLGATYRRAAPDAGAAEVVDALMAAYCPAIAASSAPTYQKVAELRRDTKSESRTGRPGQCADHCLLRGGDREHLRGASPAARLGAGFWAQVIQTLQSRSLASNKG
jgi:hypothetical protein